jgi:dolichyl-diphosphooligosaccharide---protein glycosyltransferase
MCICIEIVFSQFVFLSSNSDPKKAHRRADVRERKEREAGGDRPLENIEVPSTGLTKQIIKEINQQWDDNSITSNIFDLIKMNDVENFKILLDSQPAYAHIRSKDGRGPMWWAYEHGRKEIIKQLKQQEVSEKLRDKDGITPLDLKDDEF